MAPDGSRLDYRIPARGLVGFRSEFIIETRGTGILHSVFDSWEPWAGDLKVKRNGSLVADRRGKTTTHALMSLEQRGVLFVGPGIEVYEGMVVGENARTEEMNVNPTKEKKLTNMRSSTAEELERLSPHLQLSLEQALEFIAEDECVEVTPGLVRLRKVVLEQAARARRPEGATEARPRRRRRSSDGAGEYAKVARNDVSPMTGKMAAFAPRLIDRGPVVVGGDERPLLERFERVAEDVADAGPHDASRPSKRSRGQLRTSAMVTVTS